MEENQSLATNQQLGSILKFNFFDKSQFEQMQRLCLTFAYSELVPEMYRITTNNPEKKAIANCMIALEMAQRIDASPLMVMQNLIIIYGRPSWSSKFLIATINSCGRFNPLRFEFKNLGKLVKVKYTEYEWNDQLKKKVPVEKTFEKDIDNIQCIAYTTEKGSTEVMKSSPVSIEMAIKEGWYTKSGSKWQTMHEQMLMYRTASFWTNAYAPELSMGMRTMEDIQDTIDIEHEVVSEQKTVIKNAEKIKKLHDEGNELPPHDEKQPQPNQQPAPETPNPEPKKEAEKKEGKKNDKGLFPEQK